MSSVTTAAGAVESTPISPAASEYLKGRGLDPEVLVNQGVYASELRGTEVIAFPYFKDGEVVNHKYRNFKSVEGVPPWQQDKGGEQVVWNRIKLTDSPTDEPLVITEGEWDCCAAIQAGFDRAVSVPAGAPSQSISPDRDEVSNKYAFVRDLLPLIEDCREIILCTDDDTNGQVLRDDLARAPSIQPRHG